ncbi:MAG: citramalate synthase, partial [Clostridia bacterium]|nr:citramalate synthase [Clostridia bacterium]
MKIEIYDTTLRDGIQGCGVDFSQEDKLAVLHTLDRLGVTYIEVGMLTDAASAEYCRLVAGEKLETSIPVIFGQTCRPGEACRDNPALAAMAACPLPVTAVYGKSWLYQVREVLHTSEEENLRMIWDTVAYLKSAGKQVFFDAEHFFDGYSDNAEYALRVVETAFTAGADRVILCDTNGGMLPDTIGLVTSAVVQQFGMGKLGIHCHNDLGMAVAGSVSAVLSGVSQVQGTISGFGERCGNANLNTLIPVLQLKLGFDCIGANLMGLTGCARFINETANRAFNENEPFVGGYAFTHKAGTHIDGVTKAPRSFEHMDPAAVGNRRNIVISSLSGRAALADKMRTYLPPEDLTKDSPRLLALSRILKEREALGFDYEDAAASLALLIEEVLNQRRRY